MALCVSIYKLDSQKHQRCLRYQLRRIKDLKQHITRQHSSPSFSCARCYDVFENATLRDMHSRRAACAMRASVSFDGISTDQHRHLSRQYLSRGKSIPDQWYDIWDILFPGKPRPDSVRVENLVQEAAQLLQTIWRSKATEIISEVAGTRGDDNCWRTEGLVQVTESLLSPLVAISCPNTDVGISRKYTTTPTMSTASTGSSNVHLPAVVSVDKQTRNNAEDNSSECLGDLYLTSSTRPIIQLSILSPGHLE
jgi:hypothetical protein